MPRYLATFKEAVTALSKGLEVVCIATSERITLETDGLWINFTKCSNEHFITRYADEQFRIVFDEKTS